MKKIILLLILFTTLMECNNQNQLAMTPTENQKLVNQYFEQFNKHEWKKMAGMYTETVEFKDPSLGQGIVKQTRKKSSINMQNSMEYFLTYTIR